MKFKLSGQMIFEAKNLVDACRKLSHHFKNIANKELPFNEIGLLPHTNIKLKPLKGGEK